MKTKYSSIGVKILLLVFYCSSPALGQKLTKDWELESTEESPQYDILIQYYFNRNADYSVKQIWLAPTENKEKRTFLFNYIRGGHVVMSDNEKMIAFNFYYCSTNSTIILFRRIDGLHYEELKNFDIEDSFWKFFQASNKLKEPHILDHEHIECISWSDDSNSMLIRASGHGDGVGLGEGWYCVYDLKTEKFSFDLSKFNHFSSKKQSAN